MAPGAIQPLDPNLHRQGRFITLLNRWVALGLGLLFLLFPSDASRVQRGPLLLTGIVYGLLTVLGHFWERRHPTTRLLRVAYAVLDAVTVGVSAALSGGLESPFWLLLYPHAVAVAVRGGITSALVAGVLDGLIVLVLAWLTPSRPLGELNALTLLWCSVMGGIMSSHLGQVRRRLYDANLELSTANEQLSATILAHEAARDEQELALTRLRESEERYRRLIEGIQDGVVIVREGRIVYVNQVFADMVGDSPEGLVNLDMLELVPPGDRQELGQRYRRFEQSLAPAGAFEARLRTRQADTRLVSVRAGSVEFEGERSVITTVRDITRERRMEQEFKDHAQRLAAINEIANAVNLSLTIEDILRVAAEEARRLVPFDRLTIALLEDDDPGVEMVTVGPGTRRQRAAFARDEVAWVFKRPTLWRDDGGLTEVPARVHELLGDTRIRAVATVPLLSKDRVIGALNLGRLNPESFTTWDLAVTEPVARHIGIALDNARLLEAVRRRGRELESLLEVVQGIVERLELPSILPVVTRSVNRLMGTNYCLLLIKQGDDLVFGAQEGLEPEVVDAFKRMRVGQSLSGWVAREGRLLAVVDMKEDPRSGFRDTVERFGYRSFLCVPLKRGDEVLGTLEVVTKEPRRFRTEEQEIMQAFSAQAAVAIDHARLFQATRTQLLQLEDANRRLEDLDRMREEYLRNVSHEFRSPLTVIKGYAEYLLESAGQTPGSLPEALRVIIESCDRVIDLVDTLLEVSRIEQGGREKGLQVQEMDLREVVAASVEAMRRPAARKGSSLDVVLPLEPLTVQGDPELLMQVVRKLVDNALKYSPPGSRVVIRARLDEEDTEARLEVEDTGIGIPAEHLPRIFEKFYMVDGGIARQVGGTGVGLYLVREIVRLHDGRVAVRSHPGRGSVFSVHLPRRARKAGARTALA